MEHLPLFVRVKDRRVLIIGGGAVGLRKARPFCEAGGLVTVIAPAIDPGFAALPGTTRVERAAQAADLDGDWFCVILATDDVRVQESLAREGAKRRLLVNRCDAPDHSDFVTAALVDCPPLIVGVHAGGLPGLSQLIKRRVAGILEPAVAELAEFLVAVRPRVKARFATPGERADFFRAWTTEAVVERWKQEGPDEIRAEVERCLSS